MENHKFLEKDLDNNTWMVKCKTTGGSFSTNLWRLGKIQNQTCPCCNELIKSGKKKK